ncbi:hypothetical protein ACN4EG_16665 [Alkalinema pantanalense CENA528]|uniref:hypothetical protein n=1 Tax=Alkalinema pantanalense TaxID=1620705 RepID=UPI003D6E85EA
MALADFLAQLYGPHLENAQQSQLLEVLCCCSIEIDSRHSVERLGTNGDLVCAALENASDEEILTAVLAVAGRLRCPKTTIATL